MAKKANRGISKDVRALLASGHEYSKEELAHALQVDKNLIAKTIYNLGYYGEEIVRGHNRLGESTYKMTGRKTGKKRATGRKQQTVDNDVVALPDLGAHLIVGALVLGDDDKVEIVMRNGTKSWKMVVTGEA